MQQSEHGDEPEHGSQISPSTKSKILSGLIVVLAIVCFSLSIFAVSAANTFFSFIFKLTSEKIAKLYLGAYYSFLGLTYLAIFGFVIVISSTAIYFTKFNQKQRIIILHLIFYLAFLICGIVALVQHGEYIKNMQCLNDSGRNCSQNGGNSQFINFEGYLAPKYVKYRGDVTTYFIGYCICFFLYGLLMFYVNYNEKRQQEKVDQAKNIENIGGELDYDNQKNQSITK